MLDVLHLQNAPRRATRTTHDSDESGTARAVYIPTCVSELDDMSSDSSVSSSPWKAMSSITLMLLYMAVMWMTLKPSRRKEGKVDM